METLKQESIKAISKLPEESDIDEIMYRLYVLDKIKKGKEAVLRGEVLTIEELKKRSSHMVIWSVPAKEALKQIHDFIGKDSEFYSQKVVDDIILSTEQIEHFPKSGKIVPEILEENIREIFIYSYRIIYEINEANITILNIVHGSRDFKQLNPL